jgi:hypothetical protein
VLTDQLS